MAKLILSLDGTVLREVVLDSEKLTIGRKPHNDLQIDNLAVSGEHAVVRTVHNDSFIEDLQSTNGTQVNGTVIQKHMLQDGDVVEIGKYKLKYVREGQGKAVAEDFEKTMVIRPGATPTFTPPPTMPAATPAPATTGGATFRPDETTIEPITPIPDAPPVERAAVIKVLSGGNAGKTLELTKNLTSLGKPGVQVAIITRRPTGYFITHVEGPSKPVVNGTQIGIHAHELADHDVIELAGIKMEFFYK